MMGGLLHDSENMCVCTHLEVFETGVVGGRDVRLGGKGWEEAALRPLCNPIHSLGHGRRR